jgi:hypothetical protein
MLADKVDESLDGSRKPTTQEIQEYNDEAMRKLAGDVAGSLLAFPANRTFEARRPLFEYFEALSKLPGRNVAEEDRQGIPTASQVDSFKEILAVDYLALRGTDGSRIAVADAFASYDLLRWERCNWCGRDEPGGRTHPVLLGMVRQKVVSSIGRHKVACQVIVCDKTGIVQHIYGK